ncbi:sugar-binding transcriptional regulator [Palleronia sp. LCG004]|uniref:sugar-binding transcriptional regulator n=1 Tax=Palleronia sp. LCG004 TaxID=3079304 RepID=UPI002942B3F5|nr:sugar-binding domain-containing protein [Palleronia sp. LCG004]WOI56292.1 sugar-binding domain-containing protein [Palleronia sp. LCG004]
MSRGGRSGTEKRAALANVALLYYGEQLTQGEIATRIGVSRATILNMLREARDLGIVDIRVDGSSVASSDLGARLAARFGLESVYVARGAADGIAISRDEMLRLLGRVGAIALTDLVRPGDRVGVAWGETIRAVSSSMPAHPVADVRVFQMIGSMISDRVPASELCAIEIANALDALCYTLHAPALASSREIADLFRAEPTIAAQLEALSSLDLVTFSVGNVGPETHVVQSGMVSPAELAAARGAGARGILCSRFIDAAGGALDLPPAGRVISAMPRDFLRAPRRLMVVGGEDRLEAATAALGGGYATHLCVDHELALRLDAPDA